MTYIPPDNDFYLDMVTKRNELLLLHLEELYKHIKLLQTVCIYMLNHDRKCSYYDTRLTYLPHAKKSIRSKYFFVKDFSLTDSA